MGHNHLTYSQIIRKANNMWSSFSDKEEATKEIASLIIQNITEKENNYKKIVKHLVLKIRSKNLELADMLEVFYTLEYNIDF